MLSIPPDRTPKVLINGTEVPQLWYQGQPVVTFRQVDEFHQRPEGTARKAYNRHQNQFKQGVHAFVLQMDEAKALGVTAPSGLVVLTQRGYLKLTKPFTDQLSWDIQDELIDRYFTTSDENRRMSVAHLDHDTKVEFAAQMLHDPRVVLQAFERMAFHAKVLEDQIDILRPKAAFHDAVNASQGSMTVKRAAQLCGTGQNRMFRWLRDHHYLQAGNQPYQRWLDQGLFEMRIRTFNVDGTTFTRTQPLITPKGLVRFQREMGCGEAVAFELDANVPGGVL